MKKYFCRWLPLLMLFSVLSVPALAQNRIGIIDLNKVFKKYWKTEQAELELRDRKAVMDKDIKSYEEDFNKAKAEYQKLLASANDQALSSEERDRRKAAADAKLKEMDGIEKSASEYNRAASVALEQKMDSRRGVIIKDIRAVIDSKAQASNYTLVLDISAEGLSKTPAVLYSNGENDITDAVITQLNSTAPVTPSAATDSKTEKKEEKKP